MKVHLLTLFVSCVAVIVAILYGLHGFMLFADEMRLFAN